jgi:hypothetical protein
MLDASVADHLLRLLLFPDETKDAHLRAEDGIDDGQRRVACGGRERGGEREMPHRGQSPVLKRMARGRRGWEVADDEQVLLELEDERRWRSGSGAR